MKFYCLIFIILPSFFTYSTAQSKSEMKNNCPPTCHCNKTTISCKKSKQPNTDIFLGINDRFFPNLDTLIINGNDFGELEANNLFGPEVIHHSLQRLDLSDNNITVLTAEAFEGMPNLEELDMARNKIREIKGDLFAKLPRLHRIFLSSAFDEKLNSSNAAELLHGMLTQSESEFGELEQIYLDNNNFVFLKEDTFCSLPALEILWLENNELSTFRFEKNCFPGLRELYLNDNRLQFMPKNTFEALDSLVHLERIKLAQNPFICDCYFQDFLAWSFKNRDLFSDEEQAQCADATPLEYIGMDLKDVDWKKLKCPKDGSQYLHNVYIFVALAFVGLLMLLACLAYSNKGSIRKLGKYQIIGGYHKLEPEEVDVKPEFV